MNLSGKWLTPCEVVFANQHASKELGRGWQDFSWLPREGDKYVAGAKCASQAGVDPLQIWTVKHVIHNFRDDKFQVYVWAVARAGDWL